MRTFLTMLALFSGWAMADVVYKTTTAHHDGSYTYHHVRLRVDGVDYGIRVEKPDRLCEVFGFDLALDYNMKRSWWGSYEVMLLDEHGNWDGPKTSDVYVRDIRCVNAWTTSVWNSGGFAPWPYYR
ncbi:MAG: hypothetical protein KF799_15940 [Bdellovibrionales bacterium]|nr:hypothetical protein [Bdellovibrionales bacterium]